MYKRSTVLSKTNPILDTDSYKTSHYLQYPPNTTHVSSYIESRGINITTNGLPHNTEIVHFGLQMFIKKNMMNRVTTEDIDEAEGYLVNHGFKFNRAGWEHIVNAHGGYMPVEIEAAPEGTVMEPHNVQVQIRNTDPDVPWVTSFLETALLRAVWYPSTVATISREIKKIIYGYLEETCDNPDADIDFRLHDFGARGATSAESAMIGGVAHPVNFQGTDTLGAIVAARQYYDAFIAGFSIPASEHSTMTAWGIDNEVDAYENMIAKFGNQDKAFAVVSDSYDIYNAVENIWGGVLKGKVANNKGTLVIRPDSEDPIEVTENIMSILFDKFGYTTNKKGYKVLPSFVRIIQGDGVNPKSIGEILENFMSKGISAENISFGMGGALLQKLDRDTLKYAMKANAISINDGDWTNIYKNPVRDTTKRSKAGRQILCYGTRERVITRPFSEAEKGYNIMDVVYRKDMGQDPITKYYSLREIRERAKL